MPEALALDQEQFTSVPPRADSETIVKELWEDPLKASAIIENGLEMEEEYWLWWLKREHGSGNARALSHAEHELTRFYIQASSGPFSFMTICAAGEAIVAQGGLPIDSPTAEAVPREAFKGILATAAHETATEAAVGIFSDAWENYDTAVKWNHDAMWRNDANLDYNIVEDYPREAKGHLEIIFRDNITSFIDFFAAKAISEAVQHPNISQPELIEALKKVIVESYPFATTNRAVFRDVTCGRKTTKEKGSLQALSVTWHDSLLHYKQTGESDKLLEVTNLRQAAHIFRPPYNHKALLTGPWPAGKRGRCPGRSIAGDQGPITAFVSELFDEIGLPLEPEYYETTTLFTALLYQAVRDTLFQDDEYIKGIHLAAAELRKFAA